MYLASDDADAQSRNAAFLQGLQEMDWAVGRNVSLEVPPTLLARADEVIE